MCVWGGGGGGGGRECVVLVPGWALPSKFFFCSLLLLQSVANWIDRAVKKALTAAIRERCSCNFQSTAIENGEFSCQSTTTHVVYRTMINGTSDTHTAPQLLNFIEDWIKNEGAFLVGYFRLRVVPECPLQIQSFYQPECTNDESTSKRNSTMISRKVP